MVQREQEIYVDAVLTLQEFYVYLYVYTVLTLQEKTGVFARTSILAWSP